MSEVNQHRSERSICVYGVVHRLSGHEKLVAALAAPGLRVVLEREAPAGLNGHVHRLAGVAPPATAPARRRR